MEYYKPDLSEFKQGFKYQLQTRRKGDKDFGLCWIDCMNPENTKTTRYENEEDVWIDQEVWWDRPVSTEFKVIEYYGSTFYVKEHEYDLKPNYSLEIMLQNGKIRAER